MMSSPRRLGLPDLFLTLSCRVSHLHLCYRGSGGGAETLSPFPPLLLPDLGGSAVQVVA